MKLDGVINVSVTQIALTRRKRKKNNGGWNNDDERKEAKYFDG